MVLFTFSLHWVCWNDVRVECTMAEWACKVDNESDCLFSKGQRCQVFSASQRNERFKETSVHSDKNKMLLKTKQEPTVFCVQGLMA